MQLKNYIHILLGILFLLFGCSKGKKNKNFDSTSSDSLSIYISFAQNNNLTADKRLIFNTKAFLILSNKDNSIDYRSNLFAVAKEFSKLQNYKESRKALDLILAKAIEKKDTLHIAKAYHLLGSQNIDLGKNDSAYYYLLKSEKLFIKLNDSLSLGQNYIDKAFVQLYENDFTGCEHSAVQALVYYKNFNIRQREYDAYNLVGISSNELKNFDNAIIYHKKALEYVNKYEEISTSKFHYRASTLNNLGYVYQNLNNHREAINTFKRAVLDKGLLMDYPSLYAMITDNLAYSKFKLNDYSDLPDLFFKSLEIREKNKLYSGIINNKIHLSEFFAAKNDTVNSQKYANEALQLAKTTKVSGDLLASLKQLSTVEHKKASQYSKEYINISDSIQQEERNAKNKFARIAFETDQIIGEKDKLEEQNRNLLYFFIGTLGIGLLLFIIRTQRAKNRELVLKQQQQVVNEEIYNLMISQ